MLRKKLTVLGSGCFLAMSAQSAMALADPDRNLLTLDSSASAPVASKGRYIVQMKGNPAVTRDTNTTIPERRGGVLNNVKYNPNTAAAVAYRQALLNKQSAVINSVGITSVTHQYEHAFNGFSATLTDAQVTKLRANPDVAYVWPDEVMHMDTANTPQFLGITDPSVGLHDLGTKGEDIIIGIVDSGIWPENPSLDDTGFGLIADTRPDWNGVCDSGTDPDFACNNKLIGARYYDEGARAGLDILPGEFDSPRDADGHGTHVATTAGGNENVAATILGVPAGNVTGMAPRARIAAYKVCWNGSADGNSGCFPADTVKAIDDAVADGVDVINMSISGSRSETVDPVHAAFFNASQAGVYSAISAGNSGPGPETVAHNIPWATTVAASTYDGESVIVGTELNIDSGNLAGTTMFSIPGGITAPIPAQGFSGELGLADPVLACDPLTTDLTGKIALISRGACAFSTKLLNAQAAGATGMVIYTDSRTPIAMGGDGTGVTIPGVMVTAEDGALLTSSVNSGPTEVTMTNTPTAGTATEVGNIMADFSSRGAPQASSDLIKPDITAPGVAILAGASGANIDTGVTGENYQYLQGTSMSSPHIAGLAALVREVRPSWTPAQVKSALMTTSRQNMVKEDGTTPADPFDFGAGHVVPNSATNPGLVYSAGEFDYFAFLCGLGENAFVETNLLDGAFGASACPVLEQNNYPTDASDLNLPSIAIGELAVPQTVTRFVDNVDDVDSTYSATIETPAGVDVELQVLNRDTGTFEPSNDMFVAAGDFAVYQLTFSKNESAVLDEWAFGSITWDDGTHSVRSPIAIRPAIPPRIIAPTNLDINVDGPAARTSLNVDVAYTGRFFTTALGLDESAVQLAITEQDEDRAFSFNEPSLGFYFVNVPEGTRVAKFALDADDYPSEAVDIDLFVWACPGFSCTQVGSSENAGSEENVVLVDPQPLANLPGQDIYVVFTLGYDLGGAESLLTPLHLWTVSDDGTTEKMVVRASSRAREGRTTRVSIGMTGLEAEKDYVGAILYTDENGDENDMTVIEVNTDTQAPE